MTLLRIPIIKRSYLFYIFFFPLSVAAFASRNDMLMAMWAVSSFSYLSVHIGKFTQVNERTILVLITALAATLTLPFALFDDLTACIHYYVCISTLLLAYFLSKKIHHFALGVSTALISLQTYTLIYLLQSGLDGYPLEAMIPNSSSNGITSYLVVLQASYCAIQYILYRKISFFTSLITLFICFIGFGRGSLIGAGLICAFSILFYALSSKKRRFIVVVFIGITVPLVGPLIIPSISDYVKSKTKLGGGIYDPSRALIHEEYLKKITPTSLLIGSNYKGTIVEELFNGNPHSSYIRGHHLFGFFYLASVVSFTVALLFIKSRKIERFFAITMTTIILLRAATEPILFPTPLDIFYYGIFFSLITLAKSDRAINN